MSTMSTNSGQSCGVSPDRIPELMAQLQAHWQRNPDLRLMQLLVALINPKEPCPEVFYAKDEALAALLKKAP